MASFIPDEAAVLTPEELGFLPGPRSGEDAQSWTKDVGGRTVRFRRLRSVQELKPVEDLQRAVFTGLKDADLLTAEMLIAVEDTGGFVLGAFIDSEGGEIPAGFSIGWGGFVRRRPRLLSDYLGVRAEFRGGGLGAELKKLQAALALEAGFPEIVWTVDPLRAANARLNFEKLGAYCDRYEVDRYGSGFAEGLYGGLPSDRLLMTWPITAPAVRERLLGRLRPHTPADIAGLPSFEPGAAAQPPRVLVPLPADIDRLLIEDPAAARRWRETLRAALPAAFDRGYAITGFVTDPSRPDPAVFLLEYPSPSQGRPA